MNIIEIDYYLVNMSNVKYIRPTKGIEIVFIDGHSLSFNIPYEDFKNLLLKNYKI